IKQGNRRTGSSSAKGNGGANHPAPYNNYFVLRHTLFGCYIAGVRFCSTPAILLTPLFFETIFRQNQSSEILLSRITLPHFTLSASIIWANSLTVPGATVAPRFSCCFMTLGSDSTALISAL